jgi:hypothetical protein
MTSSTTPSATDATGRTIQAGDTVGGTTSGRYQTTITGPVVQFGKGKVKVRVTNRPSYGGLRDANGDDTWISTDRVFLVHPATERRFLGFRTPDDRVWTVAARTKGVLWETPMVAQRYEGPQLRSVYQGNLHPVWEDVPAPATSLAADLVRFAESCTKADLVVSAQRAVMDQDTKEVFAAFCVAARAGVDLDQELLDDAMFNAVHVREAGDSYPPVLPWAPHMDDDDLIGFLNELAGVMQDARHMATEAGPVHARRILTGLEKTCGTWRLIAEAQHAHNTAPGPDAEPTA